MTDRFVPGVYVPGKDAYLPSYYSAIELLERINGDNINSKVIKIVRTVSGMRRYQQAKGSIIIKDGGAPLDALTAVTNDVPGYEKMVDGSGNSYYIGQEDGSWAIRNPATNELMHTATSEEEAYTWLNSAVGGNEATLVPEETPFDNSPYVTPSDSQERRNLRQTLSDPKYNLTTSQAVAADRLSDVGLEAYQNARDRGMTHTDALAAANAADSKEKAKLKAGGKK